MDTFKQVKETMADVAKEAKDLVMEVADKVVETVEQVTGQQVQQAPRDALEILKEDHNLVASYFEQIENASSNSDQTREGLFAQLKYELETHATVEERLFYPAIRNAPQGRELVPEALDQHDQVKKLLAELAAMPIDDKEWMPKLRVLNEKVDAHVSEEETELFAIARSTYSEEELRGLGHRIVREKEQLAAEEKQAPGTRRNPRSQQQSAGARTQQSQAGQAKRTQQRNNQSKGAKGKTPKRQSKAQQSQSQKRSSAGGSYFHSSESRIHR